MGGGGVQSRKPGTYIYIEIYIYTDMIPIYYI